MEPRIPPLPPEERSEEVQELLAGAGVGSGDGGDMNIFATFARHPKLTKRWMAFGGVLLFRGTIPERERELLILRTAYDCQAEYEWGQHVVIGKRAGLTDAEIERVVAGPEADGWEPFDATLLRAVDELHADAVISDPTWAQLAARYDEQQLIELTMLVGQYHLVAFALNSLKIQREPGIVGFPS